MLVNLSAAAEFANFLNDSYNESYALVSADESQHGTCAAVTKCLESERPGFDEPGNEPREPTPPGFILCCVLVTLILFMALVDLILIAFTVILTIFLLMKKFFGRTFENENNNENDNDPVPAVLAAPVPPQEDSRSPKGDQLPNRRHRRQRRTGRSPPPPPSRSAPPPPVANNPPHPPTSAPDASAARIPDSAAAPPPPAADSTTTQTVPSSADAADSKHQQHHHHQQQQQQHDSFADSIKDRLIRGTITGNEFEGIGELRPSCSVPLRIVGSQLKKLRRPVKDTTTQAPPDHSDHRSDRRRDADNNAATAAAASVLELTVDPASAQHQPDDEDEDSSRTFKPRKQNHHPSKSANKRPDMPVFADASYGARCDRKVDMQQPLNNLRGLPKTKVDVDTKPSYRQSADLGGGNPFKMSAEGGIGNEWFCGIERHLGEAEDGVRRFEDRIGEATKKMEEELSSISSKFGSISFEKIWEQRVPVQPPQRMRMGREYGMFMSGTNCDALHAIDTLLEEIDESDTVEVEPSGRTPSAGAATTTQTSRDVLHPLPAELHVTGRRV